MYTKQEASAITTAFWTSLGQYMKPVPSIWKEKVNWLNYKTGIKDVYIRMHASKSEASIGIEIAIPDEVIRQLVFEQVLMMKKMLEAETGEPWNWEANYSNQYGIEQSRIFIVLPAVNVFKKQDWPAIISFFKPRLIALDAFWANAKDGIEMVL